MKGTLYIRADGNNQVGLGHLVRCLAFAQMVQNNFTIVFVCKHIPQSLVNEIKGLKFSIILIVDEIELLNILVEDDLVVVDHYELDISYHQKVKDKECVLICIDDLHDKEFLADLIINHSPGIKPEDYFAKKDTKFALGPDYALLRPKFLAQALKPKRVAKIKTIFVCFGGSDFKNFTEPVLNKLLEFDQFDKINVVTGSAYDFSHKINSLTQLSQKVNYHHDVDEDQVLSLMVEADVAIVPASGILFEVLAAGCLPLTSYYVENQKNIFDGFKNLKKVLFIDSFESLDQTYLYRLLNQNVQNDNEIIIDGQSGKRILELILSLK